MNGSWKLGRTIIDNLETHFCSLMEIEWFGKSDHSQWQPFCMLWESRKSLPLIAWVMDISSFNLASISSLLHHLHWEQYCKGTGGKESLFQFQVSISFQWFKVLTRLHLRLACGHFRQSSTLQISDIIVKLTTFSSLSRDLFSTARPNVSEHV